MGSKRRRFLQDYEYRENEDGKPEAVYTGAHYFLCIREKRAFRRSLFALPVILAAVVLASGLDASEASRNLFISLPVIVSLLPSFFIATGSMPPALGKERYNEKEKHHSGERVVANLAAVSVLFGTSALAGIVYQLGVIKDAGRPDAQAAAQLFFAIAGCAAAWLYRKAYKNTVLFQAEGETGKETSSE